MLASRAMSSAYRDLPSMACPLCHSNVFVEGEVKGQGLTFVPEDAGLLSRAFAVGWGLRARKCASCHHVMLFAPEE